MSKNHQSSIYIGVTIIFFFLFLLLRGLTLSKLLNQEPTYSSGMLRQNQITLLIFFCVYVTRQIKDIVARLIFHLFGHPRPLRLSFELPLIQNCGLSGTCNIGFMFLLPTGISTSGVLDD